MSPQHWLYTIPLRLRSLFSRQSLDQELDEELQYHLEEKTQEYIEKGLSPEEAHYAALREFGNVELSKQNCRDTRRVLWIQNFLEDVRFSLRLLRKDPSFTAVAILTLALGIGANTAIFSVVNAVLLRPLPFVQPERLVFVAESSPDVPVMFISLANLADWQARNHVFASMGAYRRGGATLAGLGEPKHVVVSQVSSGLFPTLGVQPALGHLLTPEEDKADSAPVIMLSETLWTRAFGRDPNIVGRRIKLDGVAYIVIGVVPTERFPTYWRQIDAFTSLGRLEHAIGGPSNRALHIGVSAYARLKPGVSVEQARNEMTAIAQRLAKQYPQTNAGQGVVVQPLMEREVGSVSRPLQLLMAAVVLVLLIACVNVANLLTSRAIVRQREIAIRSALGAGLGRLIAQLLCESTLLAIAGGALGLLGAYCATVILGQRAAAILPRGDAISIDGWVLLFTAAIALITGLIFGVIPALAAYRSRPMEALQENGRSPRYGLWRVRVRSVLATVELAVALVLLVAAGLTVKSLFQITRTDLGIQTDGVMTAVLNLPGIPYKTESDLDAVTRKLIPRVLALPHVTAAGFESAQLVGGSQVTFRVEGDPGSAGDQEPYAAFSSITPGTLEALGARLIAGRFFAWSDGPNTQPVCVIDDSMSARYWPGESAIGKQLTTDVPTTPDGKPLWRTVVGVVHRVTINAADEQHLVEIFIPYSQYQVLRRGRLVVRSDGDPSALMADVRRAVNSMNPDLPLYDVRSLSELVDENIAARRLEVLLLSLFATIALVLAALGVYGVMAYMVNGRLREIGLRRALGAKPRDILQLILSQAIPLILIGAGVGVVASLFLKRALSTVLFGVSPTDPSTIAAVAGILVMVALVACCVPLRHAMRIDPIHVLRRE